MEIYHRQPVKMGTLPRTKLPEIPELRGPSCAASRPSHELRMPILPDPGKTDDSFAQHEKLDFSVSLGSSIARGHESDNRRVAKQLNLTIKADNSGLTPEGSSKTTPSPRGDGKWPSPRLHGGRTSSTSTCRSRRESRRSSILKSEELRNLPEINIESARSKLHRVLNTVKIITGVCLALKRIVADTLIYGTPQANRVDPDETAPTGAVSSGSTLFANTSNHATMRYVQLAQTTNWSFMEMYLHVKKDLDQLVAFNPHSFARVEPESLKLRKLLYKPRHSRTAHDVKVILALMRGNASFQDYPAHIQVQLASCMTYQSYEARRVILKQGHRAEAFYILLSGFVIANVEDRNQHTGKTFVKTVKEMGPGDTFGEIALIDGGRRTASIVCKTSVELLVILKDDFDSIIRAPLVKQIDEHVEFCKTMTLFQDFPCDQLAENPSQFFYHYFKKDDVVVKDSKQSKYIIVVKAGKCRVIGIIPGAAKSRRKPRSAAMKRDLDSAFPNYDDMQKVTSQKRKPITDADKLKNIICLGLLTGKIDRTRLADHGPDVQLRPKTSMTHKEMSKHRNKAVLKKSKSLSDVLEAMATDMKKAVKTDDDLYTQVRGHQWGSRLRLTTARSRKRVTTPAAPQKAPVVEAVPARLSSSRLSRRKSTANSFYEAESFTYAQIAELPSGTVFGLESLVQRPAVTFSLVSDGAECIFISKRLFLNLANIKVLRIVTDMIQTYPSPEFIQEQVRQYRDWNRYKSCLVQGVLNRHR